MKIEVNKIMNPAFLLGTAFNIAYWHRKYHSGTICKGVSNPQISNALSGCEIPKWLALVYKAVSHVIKLEIQEKKRCDRDSLSQNCYKL